MEKGFGQWVARQRDPVREGVVGNADAAAAVPGEGMGSGRRLCDKVRCVFVYASMAVSVCRIS